jgi:hypothetical protein
LVLVRRLTQILLVQGKLVQIVSLTQLLLWVAVVVLVVLRILVHHQMADQVVVAHKVAVLLGRELLDKDSLVVVVAIAVVAVVLVQLAVVRMVVQAVLVQAITSLGLQ